MRISFFLRKPIYSAFVFFGTVILLSAGYAAFNSIPQVNTGDSLTKDIWNQMATNLDGLDNRITWLSGNLASLSWTVSSLQTSIGSLWGPVTGGIGYSGGNVGIGLANPSQKLEVAGNIKTSGSIVYSDGTTQSSALALIPSGAVIAFNRTTCPAGWTEANGAGGRPNLRGQFIRGWNSTASGLDPNRAFWSAQNATRVISNYWGDGGWSGAVPDVMNKAASDADSSGRVWDGANNAGGVAYPNWPQTNATHNAHVDGMRVRPANVALLYCVKD